MAMGVYRGFIYQNTASRSEHDPADPVGIKALEKVKHVKAQQKRREAREFAKP